MRLFLGFFQDRSEWRMDIVTYIGLSDKEKVERIKEELNQHKKYLKVKIDKTEIIIEHIYLGLEFVYIPSGKYLRGLSDKELSQAKKICDRLPFNVEEMRPTMEKSVSNFLVTRTPILNSFIKKYMDISYYDMDSMTAAYVKKEVADNLCDMLSLRLPTEDEWEYFVRANSTDLFTFGNTLPDDTELDKWLNFDFSDLKNNNCNRFGLYGIYTGDWCNNHYKKSYQKYEKEESDYSIRGGGAYFWPWQDNEWIWCMSAMRMPSSELIDNECGFRLIMDI